jgi:hypothetical protein
MIAIIAIMKTLAPLLYLTLLSASAHAAIPNDHREFEATLNAPFRGDGGDGGDRATGERPDARTFTLSFDYPGLDQPRAAAWQLDLLAPSGQAVAHWQGQVMLSGRAIEVPVRWPGQTAKPGIYRVRLHAAAGTEEADQTWSIAVGRMPAPPLPAFAPLPTTHGPLQAAPAPGALPYTVYYGNLHSQTHDSDGGAAVAECDGAQDPQSAPYGPDAAYPYARAHGLDLLMVSEHNHMFDGSDRTNADADPAPGKERYQAGLATARNFSATHKDFLALYGLEWGVISNGGHLNIFNTDALLGWERNAKGELLADTDTPRGDYAGLYALMKARGWIGQFNHPAPTGQFVVNGVPLAYTEEGDAAMALCEVVNSSAYSKSETEGEIRRSNFETACNKLLEAGYHVAFSSNQDNHCANWGASYSNRSAVLLPNGMQLTRTSFLDALRARRVFATMDKDAQLVFSANEHLMGERFDNGGPLRLRAQFASASGHQAASVAIIEGVPGRNGEVTQLTDRADITLTPTPGAHFYYAKVTQDDGKALWSAPVWVTQAARMSRREINP